ncbi:MAG: PAS domain S-box protein [Deltaproteobacteria bacterium]|nr:PAS domain S-box protein [Deltaproteobacteria bacterium]
METSVPEIKSSRSPFFNFLDFLKSIRGNLLLLLFFVFIPILIVQASQFYDRYQGRKALAIQNNLERAWAASDTFRNYVQDIIHRELAIGLALTLTPHRSPSQTVPFLTHLDDEYQTISHVHWIDPEGRINASSRPEAVGLDYGDRPYLKEIVSGKEWVVSDLYRSGINGLYVFSITRGILDRRGRLQGAVSAVVNPAYLEQIISGRRIQGGSIFITDRQGRLVFRRPAPAAFKPGQSLVEAVPILKNALQGRETAAVAFDPRGEKRVMGLVPIPPFGWVAGAGLAEKEITAPILSSLTRHGILFLLGILASLLLAGLLAQRIARPVRRLSHQARVLAEGDPGSLIPVEGPSELLELGQVFNSLAQQLSEQREALRKANAELEIQVKERTAELVVANKELTAEIQEHIAARQNLERLSYRHNLILNSVEEGIAGLNTKGDIIFINQAGAKILGWEVSELRGRSLHAVTRHALADGTPIAQEACRAGEAFQKGLVQQVAGERYYRKDGTPFPVEYSSTPFMEEKELLGSVVVFRDVTARRQAEEALRFSEEKFSRAFRSSPVWVALNVLADGRFFEVNETFLEITGFSRDEVIGRTAIELGLWPHPEERAQVMEIIQAQKALRNYDITFKMKSGELRHFLWSGELMEIGGVPYLISVLSDITRLKQTTDQLRFLSSRLLTTREEECKRLARELHDSIGGTLSAAKLIVEAALGQIARENPEVALTPLERVVPALQYAIRDARRIYMNLHPSILELGIKETLNWFSRELRENHPGFQIETRLDIEEEGLSEALQAAIFRIVQEATRNSIKYGEGDRIRLSLVRRDSLVELVVEDNGRGFDREEVESRDNGQKGLGLISMRERTELSGGFFAIFTAKGAGTKIRAAWPI